MDPFVIALLGAAATASFSVGIWYPLHRAERAVQRRLDGLLDTGRPQVPLAQDLGGRRRSRLSRRLTGRQPRNAITRYLERKIAKAQLDSSAGELIVGAAALAVVVSVVFSLLAGPLLGIVAGVAVPALVVLWLNGRFRRIRAKFNAQLADTVSLLASSLRAGHSVQQAFEQASEEAPQPTSGAFALTVREIGLGAPLEQAMARLAERYPSDDMELIATAINVHQEIGGSLSKILDVTAETIRERLRVDGDIKTLTAQQRYSAYVLALMPAFMLVALYVINPEYAGVLFEPGTLRLILVAAGVLVLIGFFVMRRMADVDI